MHALTLLCLILPVTPVLASPLVMPPLRRKCPVYVRKPDCKKPLPIQIMCGECPRTANATEFAWAMPSVEQSPKGPKPLKPTKPLRDW